MRTSSLAIFACIGLLGLVDTGCSEEGSPSHDSAGGEAGSAGSDSSPGGTSQAGTGGSTAGTSLAGASGQAGSPAAGAAGSPVAGAAGSTSAGAAGSMSAGSAGSTAGGSAAGTSAGGSPACIERDSGGGAGAVYIQPSPPPEGQACDVDGLTICTGYAPGSPDPTRTLSRCQGGQWATLEHPSTCEAPLSDCNWGSSVQNVDAIHDGVCCDTLIYCAKEKAFCDGTRWHALPATP